jgi:hypothetical protein
MGRSPVSVTRNKKFLLDNKLKRLSSRFTNKKYLPRVHFFVVMTGNADFSQLPEVDLQHTISLKEFLRFSDKGKFNEYFRPHPDSQVLNQDIPVFDELFLKGNTAPKALKIGGYTAVEEIFEHPNLYIKSIWQVRKSRRVPRRCCGSGTSRRSKATRLLPHRAGLKSYLASGRCCSSSTTRIGTCTTTAYAR